MKKLTLLLAALACLCSGTVNAQDGKGSINFVPYVGVNYSDFSGDTDLYFGGTSGKVNFIGGARFEFQIADKSAIIADVNYRRLGATADNYSEYLCYKRYSTHGIIIPCLYKNPNEHEADILRQQIKESVGHIWEFKKVTCDCVSLAVQFKKNLISDLYLRVGFEGYMSFSELWHVHYTDYYYSDEGEKKCDKGYKATDIGEFFADQLNLAVPLGVTYDYKNYSINATYHLPFTYCSRHENGNEEYSMKHQAFDLTIGYRLPLRKR